MNKKGQSEILISVLIIAAIVLLVYGIGYVDTGMQNHVMRENCRIMENNGHNVKVEPFNGLVYDYVDCYIETVDMKFVPYDRYRGVSE